MNKKMHDINVHIFFIVILIPFHFSIDFNPKQKTPLKGFFVLDNLEVFFKTTI